MKALTTERDESREASTSAAKDLSTLRAEHDKLNETHTALQTEQASLQSTLDSLRSEHDTLKSTHSDSSTSMSTLEDKLSSLQTELTATKASLGTTTKRAETAEKRREGLQSENDELVKQLAEVRGRVVEVMEEKADLAGRMESLESRSKADAKALESVSLKLEEQGTALAAAQSVDHTIEISQQAAKIRELESALHAATSRVHSLTRQLASSSSASTSSQNLFYSADENKRPGAPQRLPSVDMLLPASVRHKRQVSLAGLKARMGTNTSMNGRSASGLGTGAAGAGGMDSVSEDLGLIGRKQFGDEIMFCCPACEGDLITL